MLFEACLTVEIGVGSVDFFGFLQQSLSPAMTYEALVDVDDAHLAELNIGLHTIHEVAKCIMSAKGDNTSFPPSYSCLRLMAAEPFQTRQSGLHVRLSILFYRFWHGRDRVEKRREETYKSTLGGYSGIDNAIDC